MEGWAYWEMGLLAVAAYVAVLALVRLMLAHRDQLAQELEEQLAAEQRRLTLEQMQAQREKRRQETAENRRAA